MLKDYFNKHHLLIEQALTLGGIYFIVVNIFKLLPFYVPTPIYMFCVSILLAALVILLVKKSFPHIEKIGAKYPKINRYLQALGASTYITAITTIIPYIYFLRQVKSDNSYQVPIYSSYINFFNWIILLILLLLATYYNFIKTKTAANHND